MHELCIHSPVYGHIGMILRIAKYEAVIVRVRPEVASREHTYFADLRHENEDYIYLNDFAVTKGYRNKGIGSALLKAAELYAKEINTLKLCLHVEKMNPSAMQRYRLAQ